MTDPWVDPAPWDNPAFTKPAEYIECNDCGTLYLGPPYYEWECEDRGCAWSHRNNDRHNYCPQCADGLEPNWPNDPRDPHKRSTFDDVDE